MPRAHVGGFVVALVSIIGLAGCGDTANSALADWTVPPRSEPVEVAAPTVDAAATVTVSEPPAPSPTAAPSITPTPTTAPEPTVAPSATEPGEPPATEQELMEAEVVELTNAERTNAGCAAVVVDDRLAAASRAHSEDMVERDFFDHVNPDGDGPGDRASAAGYDWWSGENIAWGYRTPEDVVEGWMNSPGHRANILNCDSVAIGVGVADSSRGPYWTQMFGRR